jgi:uncharacterized membrane protein
MATPQPPLEGAYSGPSPTRPHAPAELTPTLERNILAMKRRRERDEARAGLQYRIGDAITRFTGSMTFVFLHLALFGFWIVANLGWLPGIPKWDESFASVEAIFLSTFVLMSQNRMQAAADRRADLDLQISLLAEHEVTKLAAMVAAIAEKLGVHSEVDEEVEEIKRDIAPEAVLDGIEANDPKTQ